MKGAVGGMGPGIPHLDPIRRLAGQFVPLFWLPFAAGVVAMFVRPWRSWAYSRVGILFAIHFTCLCFSKKIADRYSAPLMLLAVIIGAVGAAAIAFWIVRLIPKRLSVVRLAAPTVIGLLVGLLFWQNITREQRKQWNRNRREFTRDMRVDLTSWINTQLPAEARIHQSRRAALPDPGAKFLGDERAPVQREILTVHTPMDAESVDALRKEGWTHVVIDSIEVNRTRRGADESSEDAAMRLEKRVAFLADLEARSRLLWKRGSGRITAMSPRARTVFVGRLGRAGGRAKQVAAQPQKRAPTFEQGIGVRDSNRAWHA
jgi:hypothetical protein